MASESGIIPLTGVAVEGKLAGAFLSVKMTQRWTNLNSGPCEALWHFPLPAGAAVRSLAVERKGKRQTAIAELRDKAFDTYDRALDEGARAALLDAETQGILSFRLGNLDAGESMLVEVGWVQMIEETAESLRVSIPTAIGPRYFPVDWQDEGQIPLEERLGLPWMTAVPYGISVCISIEDSSDVAEVASPSHRLSLAMKDGAMLARLGGDFAAMDRYFVLDVTMKAGRPSRAWVEHWKDCSWIAADLSLPERGTREARRVAFLIDVSGSMEGESLDSAKTALKAALGALGGEDRFGLFAFNDSFSGWQAEPRAATRDFVQEARSWVMQLQASGGTELAGALEQVWQKGNWTDVLVLTDGDVGDDARIARAAKARLQTGTRLHILGIGSAPAGDVIARIARSGGGRSTTIHPDERIEPRVLSVVSSIMSGFADRISLTIAKSDCESAAAARGAMGTRVCILARLQGLVPDSRTANFKAHDGSSELDGDAALEDYGKTGAEPGALAALWAQARIADRADSDPEEAVQALENLALFAGILSPFTSLVLVDESGEKVEGTSLFLHVPLALPHGYGASSYGTPALFSASPRILRSNYAAESPSFEFGESLHVQSAGTSARKLRAHEKPGPDWWDILALQHPGGGFSPLEEVRALLGIAETALAPGTENDEEADRLHATALCLAWLELNCAATAAEWEPLIVLSRQFLKDRVADQTSMQNLEANARALLESSALQESV
jgi:Ca-activated chloride channel family protein